MENLCHGEPHRGVGEERRRADQVAGVSGVIVDAADYYHAFYWAARHARRSILVSGWEFDSGVPLLRGPDAPAGAEVRLLKFLTVGSANLTNRSMGIDSELHASWEGGEAEAGLRRRIRRVRVSLLAEHAGVTGRPDVRALVSMEGLVGRLDELSERPGARLRRHRPPTAIQRSALSVVDPQSLPFDSDGRNDSLVVTDLDRRA